MGRSPVLSGLFEPPSASLSISQPARALSSSTMRFPAPMRGITAPCSSMMSLRQSPSGQAPASCKEAQHGTPSLPRALSPCCHPRIPLSGGDFQSSGLIPLPDSQAGHSGMMTMSNYPTGPPSSTFRLRRFSTVSACPARCFGKRATICGTSGRDRLTGTARRDVIVGLQGNDTIKGLDGNDLICGGSGRDTLVGGRGKDWLDGGGGNDTLDGGRGTDTCKGGGEADTASRCERSAKFLRRKPGPRGRNRGRTNAVHLTISGVQPVVEGLCAIEPRGGHGPALQNGCPSPAVDARPGTRYRVHQSGRDQEERRVGQGGLTPTPRVDTSPRGVYAAKQHDLALVGGVK